MQDGRDPRCGGGEVRAHAGPHGAAQAKNAAVASRGELDILHVIAAVGRGLIVLGPCFNPLHGPSKLHRAEHGDEVALDLRNLAAESAADLRRHHPQPILGNAGDDRHDEAGDVRVLRRIPHRQFAGRGGELRDRAARFHRGWNQPLLDDPIANDDRRARKRGVNVAAGHRPMKGDVARRFRVQLWRARRRRLLRIDDGGERLVLDVDQIERVVGLILGVSRRPRPPHRRRSGPRRSPSRDTGRSSALRSGAATRRESAAVPRRCRRP